MICAIVLRVVSFFPLVFHLSSEECHFHLNLKQCNWSTAVLFPIKTCSLARFAEETAYIESTLREITESPLSTTSTLWLSLAFCDPWWFHSVLHFTSIVAFYANAIERLVVNSNAIKNVTIFKWTTENLQKMNFQRWRIMQTWTKEGVCSNYPKHKAL